MPHRQILVIDDLPDVAESFALLAECCSTNDSLVSAAVAYSGEQGAELFRHLHPDLTFLDLGMPGMDGYECASRIRSLPGGAEAFLIALTGWTPAMISKIIQSPIFDIVLQKPCAGKTLEAIFRDADRREDRGRLTS